MSKETKQSNDTILGDAIAEFDSVLAGRIGNAEQIGRKGANQNRRRNVLGRGLNALMSASAIEVEAEPSGGEPTPNVQQRSVQQRKAQNLKPSFASEPVGGAKNSKNAESPGSSTSKIPSPTAEETLSGGLVYVSIDRVFPSRKQPRQRFRDEEIAELSQSIKESGLLQPIIVRKQQAASGPLASYEIVAGERRWRAAKLVGLRNVPALVRHLTDRECLELGIVENVQRTDLNAIEEAQAYQRLIAEFGATQEQVAKTVGRDRVSISNALRLLKLHSIVQQAIIEGILTAGHGRALLQLEEQKTQCRLAEKAVIQGLSVRALERMVREEREESGEITVESGRAKDKVSKERSAVLVALEERFRRALGTKVTLSVGEGGKGELRVNFYSQDELQRLIEKIGA